MNRVEKKKENVKKKNEYSPTRDCKKKEKKKKTKCGRSVTELERILEKKNPKKISKPVRSLRYGTLEKKTIPTNEILETLLLTNNKIFKCEGNIFDPRRLQGRKKKEIFFEIGSKRIEWNR